MTSFGWDVLAVRLAVVLGVGFVAVTVLGRHRRRRPAEPARVGPGRRRRRIDVVAIDRALTGHPSTNQTRDPRPGSAVGVRDAKDRRKPCARSHYLASVRRLSP
jgi:hypothetical protein